MFFLLLFHNVPWDLGVVIVLWIDQLGLDILQLILWLSPAVDFCDNLHILQKEASL